MGLITGKSLVEIDTYVGFTCNKCGLTHYNEVDDFTHQDKLHYSDTGGYGSAMGDGTKWSITLCGSCTYQLLGGYMEYEN